METKRIVLKYNNPKLQSYHKAGDVYVALDSHSGGYPYQVSAMEAHNFKTVEEAMKYAGHFDDFSVVELTVKVYEKHICNTKTEEQKKKDQEKASIQSQIDKLQEQLRKL